MLLNTNGQVLLADFGVTATMERADMNTGQFSSVQGTPGAVQHGKYLSRNTFVGTPCFMAPEVMEQTQGCATPKSCGLAVARVQNTCMRAEQVLCSTASTSHATHLWARPASWARGNGADPGMRFLCSLLSGEFYRPVILWLALPGLARG